MKKGNKSTINFIIENPIQHLNFILNIKIAATLFPERGCHAQFDHLTISISSHFLSSNLLLMICSAAAHLGQNPSSRRDSRWTRPPCRSPLPRTSGPNCYCSSSPISSSSSSLLPLPPPGRASVGSDLQQPARLSAAE